MNLYFVDVLLLSLKTNAQDLFLSLHLVLMFMAALSARILLVVYKLEMKSLWVDAIGKVAGLKQLLNFFF